MEKIVKRNYVLTFAVAAVASMALATAANAAAFTAGDLAVYRVGDGSAALSSAATAVFIDEYTTAGAFVQTITVDNTSANKLTTSGSATSEGLMTLSADGHYLVLPGYNAAVGTASVASSSSATISRVIGRVDANGVNDNSTAFNAYSGNNIRGAASTDGNTLYAAGAATPGISTTSFGTVTAPTSLGSGSTNIRALGIYAGQLFFSTSSGSTFRIGTAGTGTPTSGSQTYANLPGFPTSTGSPYAFAFFDADPTANFNGTGLDTLYVADDASAAGLEKFIFDGTNWVAKGNVAISGGGLRGITGVSTPDGIVLYGTVASASTNAIVTYTDAAPYSGTISGSLTTIATASANEVFRGIAFAPTSGSGDPVPEPASLSLLAVGALTLLARRRKA